jgi:alpha-1,3-fucosyltransferase
LCEDYITEKFYEAFKLDLIPVAFGSANYNLFAPPKSFIDANQFATVKELAEYLKFLKENPEEYVKFFWWRKFYKVNEREFGLFCNLCEKLHETSRPKIMDRQRY